MKCDVDAEPLLEVLDKRLADRRADITDADDAVTDANRHDSKHRDRIAARLETHLRLAGLDRFHDALAAAGETVAERFRRMPPDHRDARRLVNVEQVKSLIARDAEQCCAVLDQPRA